MSADEIDLEQRQRELEGAASHWDSWFEPEVETERKPRREPVINAVQSAVDDTDVDSDGVPILSARKLTQKRQRAFSSSSPWFDSDPSDDSSFHGSSASSGMDSKHVAKRARIEVKSKPKTKPKTKPKPRRKPSVSPVHRQAQAEEEPYRQMSLDEVKDNYHRGRAALDSNSPDEANSLFEELKRNGMAGDDPMPGMINVLPKDNGQPEYEPEDPDLLDEPDWKLIEEAEPEKNPDPKWCALCQVTQRVVDVGEGNHFLQELITYAEDNWGKQTVTAMATELQRKWNMLLRLYVEPESLRLPCHKQMMWKHFAYHAPTRRIEMEITQARYRVIVHRMYQTEKRDRALSTNPKVCGQWLKLITMKEKHLAELDKLRPNRVL